jgi:hypothetical protein
MTMSRPQIEDSDPNKVSAIKAALAAKPWLAHFDQNYRGVLCSLCPPLRPARASCPF